MKNTKKYTVHIVNIDDLVILPFNKKKLCTKYLNALIKSLDLYKK